MQQEKTERMWEGSRAETSGTWLRGPMQISSQNAAFLESGDHSGGFTKREKNAAELIFEDARYCGGPNICVA